MFSAKDRKYFKANNIFLQTIKEQLFNFKNGFPEIVLNKTAKIEDGIIKSNKEELNKYIDLFNYNNNNKSMCKMVPASGAASRMFKQLYEFRNTYTGSETDFLKFHSDQKLGSMYYFFENISILPFYGDLRTNLNERGYDIDKLIEKREYNFIIDAIISEDGLNYGKSPKALLKFHSHIDSARTPMEEQLVESAHYCKSAKNIANVHFTISEEHLKEFKNHLKKNRKKYQKKHDAKFKVSFSIQDKSTDSIALYKNNHNVRNDNGMPLLRPSGHGALIKNLNELNYDIIFIKNIDNVLPDRLKPETYRYKKYIGGILISLQDKIFEYLNIIEKPHLVTKNKLQEIMSFCSEKLNIVHPRDVYYKDVEELTIYLQTVMNRPIRVCGMVENQGEPGGGPFWIEDKNDTLSLQIIERNQININNEEQKLILEEATHFNPVDIVCGVKNHKGKKFNLLNYVDKSTGFITTKTYKGKEIKTQELPGLWNGAMAKWITIFAEVPIETFSPVKTVMDLFKIEHRNLLS